jgi:predicted phage terminase large subunit-like protein
MTEKQTIGPQAGPQEAFLKTRADIALLGGAAGGGKTWSILMEPLRHVGNPRFGAVIFRRTTPEIRAQGGLWDESESIYPLVGATGSRYALRWDFPSGSSIQFSHMETPDDRFNWQGSQIPLICFDEVCSFAEAQFWFMLSRNRSTCGVKPYIRATCNPDPDSFVAKLVEWWIDQETGLPIPERSGVLRYFVRENDDLDWADSPEELKDRHGNEAAPKSFTFIPAKVQDNPALLSKDPGYVANLRALDAITRARLLDGNWLARADAGKVFNRSWFQTVNAAEVPDEGVAVRYWDRAGTVPKRGSDPDYTVGVRLLKTHQGEYIVTDVVRDRLTPAGVEQIITRTMQADGPRVTQYLEQDPGQAGLADVSHLTRALAGVGGGSRAGDSFLPDAYTVRTRRPMGSKLERANPLSAMAEQGHVKLVKAPWNEAFVRELHAFPDGNHDDQVDAASGAFAVVSASVQILLA